ncbi:MAG: YbhB/YbcL family Raf kinase inhibitor-like protein [Deltaproteobacteria bacterium]|nr:YbhB/YbcL family Raf kinase inhibitor-like protein [Deltaproteobacteria bacterium]MCW5808224.1 YbhB/YbcL family Raf kinase inhibitor-like protein [Deltaproteobacteria bacterium]
MKKPEDVKKLEVTSPAFKDRGAIPSEYTCEGQETSVPLAWSKVPAGTRSVAVLVEDPDAVGGNFTHWLIVGIPPNVKKLDKGAAPPKGAVVAKNDKGMTGYAGPCPPTGKHDYHFHVYALDIPLDRSLSKAELNAAIEGHVLAEGDLVGTYQKKDDPGMPKEEPKEEGTSPPPSPGEPHKGAQGQEPQPLPPQPSPQPSPPMPDGTGRG